MKKVKLLFKTLLSLWIVYNIFVMLVMPNVGAYFGRVTANVVTPYANTVGLNAGWNFFSPEPAHPMYLKYTVNYLYTEGENAGEEAKEPVYGFFPLEIAKDNRPLPNITRKREWALMRYMVLDPKRLRVLMGPWFCRQYPGATSVDMEHVIETIPFLDQAVRFREDSVSDLSKEVQYIRESYSCAGGDEESL
ncbi:hypothetical protein [Bdellovibrio bacteriovorus]|uniref:hypothetical protein n=1 Tax=Bdellovibrio bacteriovorus TaxID=959 RepID=UPI00045BEDD3|nr:hypothetical protein [Bdellovibrio bacteriovorus]AHZ84474.1 hypothetical protein EP01_05930 [Bdellovibrio bacteriovorus]BEV68363.1 hypothetical protein Bb109J_c1783 [Bdellovibrio bacteriovorus]